MFRRHKHPWWKSFVYAFRGVRAVFLRERNFRFHLVAGAGVVVGGLFFGITGVEWGMLSLAVGLVLGMEMINTALENLCDAVKPNGHGGIRRVKDMAAGAVLVASMASVGVGVAVFLPYGWELLMKLIGSK